MKPLPAVLAALLLSAPVYAAKPVGAPQSTPEEASWFAGAHSPTGGPCCDQSDGFRAYIFYPEQPGVSGHYHPEGVILQDWKPSETEPGGFDLNIMGKWYTVTKNNVVPGGNPTHDAVAWVVFNTGYMSTSVYVRCFAPGNLS